MRDRRIIKTIDGTLQTLSLKSLYGLTSIRQYAFSRCNNLINIVIPDTVTSIDYYAFAYCNYLTEVTFNGTPETIHSTCFSSTQRLTTINVPWDEGAVANAPWGATNATINYNYTGE
jgi:hypothetical protein